MKLFRFHYGKVLIFLILFVLFSSSIPLVKKYKTECVMNNSGPMQCEGQSEAFPYSSTMVAFFEDDLSFIYEGQSSAQGEEIFTNRFQIQHSLFGFLWLLGWIPFLLLFSSVILESIFFFQQKTKSPFGEFLIFVGGFLLSYVLLSVIFGIYIWIFHKGFWMYITHYHYFPFILQIR